MVSTPVPSKETTCRRCDGKTNPKEGIVLFSSVEGAISALYREEARK